ncbi:RNA-binding with multiple splicing [Gossypium australe]|uniref:RNA-binding with multiple splicing n=1 Tax=Gossypium australe TaxID=47621 RepID=A0A5B6WEG8_9ROSI|nr:RNA-binding with multiple splicing [Gossypium australe]
MARSPYEYDPYYLQPDQDRNLINTLFVSGLPDDVKAREIHNLFRRRAGFDYCQLKYTGRGNQVIKHLSFFFRESFYFLFGFREIYSFVTTHCNKGQEHEAPTWGIGDIGERLPMSGAEVVAFATFLNHQSAIAAMHALNGVKFDPQAGSVLHIELARSNSRRKRKPGSGPYVVIDNRTKASANTQETSSDDGDSDTEEPSGAEDADASNKDELKTAKSDTVQDPENSVPAANEQLERTIDEGAQACSTLFIANLGPNCTEYELKQVLSEYPGFNMLKIRAKGGMPVAFADFEQVEQATKVMTDLQSCLLPSSDRGGMHIEYARSKMRKP